MPTKKGYRTFEDLDVWRSAADLVVFVYDMTKSFPESEKYGLTSQMRRCAVSVAANIAEGQSRGPGADFARFVVMARGSLGELRSHALISKQLGFLSDTEDFLKQMSIIARQLTSLALAVREEQTDYGSAHLDSDH